MKIIMFGAVSALALSAASATVAQTASDPSQLEEVVVTGSRIENPGFESPTPLTAVTTTELARRAPLAIADGLNQLPQFQNSVSTNGATATGPANSQRFGNYLNLRSLGTQRILVLQDGQRLQTTGNNGGVDVTLLPQMLIQRVDIVTGGASAVYGSDAVSGVVNFIIDKHLEGLKLQAQAGTEVGKQYGASWRIGAAGGLSLMDGRLHVVASAEHYHTDPVQRADIPTLAEGRVLVGLGTAASPFYGVRDARYAAVGTYGLILTGPLANNQFTPNGLGIGPYNAGIPTPTSGTNIGGDGTLFEQHAGTTQVARQTVNQFFIRPEFDFGNDLTGYVSVGYNEARYDGNPGPSFRRQTTIFSGNAYLPAAAQAALGSTPSFLIGSNNAGAPGLWFSQWSDNLLINAGLSGKFAGKFKWSIGYIHDETKFRSQEVDVNNAKYYAAVDAVRDPSGNIVCRVTLTNPGLYPGCVPLNLFGSAAGRAAWDYALDISKWRAKSDMDDVIATVSGDLFDLPAGPLSFAAGAEYRKLSFSQTSNSPPTVFPTFAGLRGQLPQFNLVHGTLNVGVGDGSENVKEAFAEVSAPVLKDSVVGDLQLNGAARLTDYSTSGRVTTWKVGGVWDPIDGLRARATVSRDIRAPTLFELFAGQQQAATPMSDPLTGVNGVIQVVSGGNADLKPEKADTLTAGIVLQPPQIRGLNFSVDYYRIKIKQAIALPYTANQLLNLCAASNYTAELCDTIIRPLGPSNPSPANFPTAILTVNQNLSSQTVEGIDLEATYAFDLGPGRIDLHGAANYLITFDQITSPGTPVGHRKGNADFAGLPLPKWRGLAGLTYRAGGFTAGVQERYVGSFDRSKVQVYRPGDNHVGSVFYTDVNASYTLSDLTGKPEVFVVVNNLFNRRPPITPQQGGPGLAAPFYTTVYDVVGRYVTLGARLRF